MAERKPKTDEMFCTSCGEIIKRKAEICPECGVRHKEASQSAAGESDVGIIVAFVDLWKVKRPIRHLLDLVLIFVSFGTYLAIYFTEAFIHYYYLKKGKYGIYNEQTDSKIWSPLLK